MLSVRKPGFFTSIQDKGRFGYRNKGVPVSGSLDSMAAEQANSLLENDANAAVLEITMTGPTLSFGAPTYFALTGADMSPTLNDEPIEGYKVYKVNSGDVLSFGKLTKGFRAYLGIKNGFRSEKVFGSRSQFSGLTQDTTILAGQELAYVPVQEFEPQISGMKPDNYWIRESIGVFKGPEFHLLGDGQVNELFDREFIVAKENNRMAYQLDEVVSGHDFSILTSATLPGTVQLTPTGRIIILMCDGQTTGGYPRILQLTHRALCVLAQKKTWDKLKFELIYT